MLLHISNPAIGLASYKPPVPRSPLRELAMHCDRRGRISPEACHRFTLSSRQNALWNPHLQPEGRKPHISRLPQRLPPAPRRRVPHPSNLQRTSPLAHSHTWLDNLQPCEAREYLPGRRDQEQCQCCSRVRVLVPLGWVGEGVLREIRRGGREEQLRTRV